MKNQNKPFRRFVGGLVVAALFGQNVLAATYQLNLPVRGFVGPAPSSAGQGAINPGDGGNTGGNTGTGGTGTGGDGSGSTGGSGGTGGTGSGGTGGTGTGGTGDTGGTGGSGNTGDGGTTPQAVLSFSPGSLTFGVHAANESATLSTTLTNTGTVTATGVTVSAASGAFSFSSSTCGATLSPGANCSVTVQFHASTFGNYSQTVVATTSSGSSADLSLSGSVPGAAASLSFVPSSISFDAAAVGSSTTKTLTLTNTGGQTANVTGVRITSGASDFSQTTDCGGSLDAGASCTVGVVFGPAQEGARSGSVEATATGLSPASATLSGQGAQPTFSVSASTVDFGTPMPSATSSRTVTLTNTGTAASGAITAQVAGSSFQLSSTTCGATLAPSASCTATVTFTAPGADYSTQSGTLTFSTGTKSSSVSLTGKGQAPVLTFSPAPLNLGGSNVGVTSAVGVITVTNPAASPAVVTGVSMAIGGNNFGVSNTCGSALASGATCQLLVQMTPTTVGALTGTIAVQTTGGLQTTDVAGTGTAPMASMDPNTAGQQVPSGDGFAHYAINFPDTYTGSVSPVQSVVFKNIGTGPLNIIGISTSKGAADFSKDNSSCITPMPAGASCAIALTFNPSSVGALTGSVVIATETGTFVLDLSGNGLLPVTLTASSSATSVKAIAAIADTSVNSSTSTSFYLIKTGTGTTGVTAVSLDNKTDFSITALKRYDVSNAAGAVDCGSLTACTGTTTQPSVQLTVKLTSTAVTGTKTGTVTVTYNNGAVVTIPLSGTVYSAIAQITPATDAAFGQILSTASATKTFSFAATGTKDLTGVYASVTGTGLSIVSASNTCGTLAAPVTVTTSKPCSVTVQYGPAAASSLDSSSKLTITSSATIPATSIQLTGSIVQDWWGATTMALQFDDSSIYDGKGSSVSLSGSAGLGSPGGQLGSNALSLGTSYGNGTTKSTVNGTLPALSGDFTIEMRIFRTNKDTDYSSTLLETKGSATAQGLQFLIDDNSTTSNDTRIGLAVGSSSTVNYISVAATKISLNTWYHLALVRQSGAYTLYVNGSPAGTFPTDNTSYPATAFALGASKYVRASPANFRQFAGYMDEFLVTNGVKYTGAFTPPSAPIAH